MNVVCISTLDKFSRFYLNIKQKINRQKNSEFKVYSIHFSGFLYTLFRFQFSSWISLKSWCKVLKNKKHYLNIIDKNKFYKQINYNELIQFHKKLSHNISTKRLQLQALAYIDIFDAVFKNKTIDFLICIGDSKLCIEIAVATAKKYNVKIRYIEQGPFGTTFFDDEGVNANLSIRKRFKTLKSTTTQPNELTKKPSKKYFRSPLYRLSDIIIMALFERTKLYPPDLKHTDLNSFKLKTQPFKSCYEVKNKPVYLLILQIPQDVNMIYHSHNFSTQTELLKSVYSNLPKNTQLIVREHPLYINKYDFTLYNYIKKHQICVDNNSKLKDALLNCDVVIVNNSTVGIEAILHYKTVVVLGNAFYDNDELCLKLKQRENLGITLLNALHYKPNIAAINTFKKQLFSSVLISGAIVDRKLKSSTHIANHLINNA